MKIGLLTFPRLTNTFSVGQPTLLAQKLEPSVLYLSPSEGELVFIEDNIPRSDIDLYLCSVYTRGYNEFVKFSRTVGRDKIVAGGYHPTAVPEEVLPLKHLNGQAGYEGFRWKMFLNDFNKAAVMLRQYSDYKEMVNPYTHYGVKMYIVEGEYEGQKKWEGPFTLGKAERVKEKRSKQEGVTNMNIKEVEPR